MKKTVITDDLIVFSDGFVWKRLSRKVAEALWNSVISHELELYWVRTEKHKDSTIAMTQEHFLESVQILFFIKFKL